MRLAAAGTQVGLTESQILGFATALSSVGIEAEMGGSAFSKALVKMEVAAATGGEALEDFAKVSGMTADQFKTLWDADPAAAFQAFIVGLSQMDEQGMSAIATLEEIGISEIRLRDTLLRATNATELFAETQIMANAAWEDNSALVEEAGKRYQTTASKLTNLKNKAVLFGQQIGDDLNPTIQNLIEGADDLLDSFLEMDEAQRLQIIKWAGIAAATGPVLLGISKVSKGISVFTGGIGKFATAVGKAGGGFKGFMSVLGKSPSVWLAVAAAVVVGIVHQEGQTVVDHAKGKRVPGFANDQAILPKGHVGSENRQLFFRSLLCAFHVCLHLVDARYSPGEIIFGLLRERTDLRLHLGHVAGQRVVCLYLLADTVSFRADLRANRRELLIQLCVAVFRRGGIVSGHGALL